MPGEKSPVAVLTDAKVRYIRSSISSTTIAALARELRVGESTVRNVVQGRTWTHLL